MITTAVDKNDYVAIFVEKMSPLKKGKKDETADQALERFDKFIKLLKPDENIDEETIEDINDHYKFEKYREVIESEIQEQEKKFGITLPQSYKNYLLKYGISCLADQIYMLMPLKTMSKELADSGFADNEEEVRKRIIKEDGDEIYKKYKNMYVFSSICSSCYLFDYNQNNVEAGDVPIRYFDFEDWSELINDANNLTFDQVISSTVDDLIETIIVAELQLDL